MFYFKVYHHLVFFFLNNMFLFKRIIISVYAPKNVIRYVLPSNSCVITKEIKVHFFCSLFEERFHYLEIKFSLT